MKIHVARNGTTLGTFDLESLKVMAASGELKRTDHVYTGSSGEWKLLSDVPELVTQLFPDAEMVPPPPPPFVPSRENFNVGGTEVERVSDPIPSPPKEAIDGSFHGYPIQYWKELFGDKTYWYLDKFKGLKTNADDTAQAEWAKNLKSPKERALVRLKEEYTWLRNFRFSLAGFIFGWGWLAYRKSTGWSAICFGASSILLIIAESMARSNTDNLETLRQNVLAVNCLSILFMTVVPGCFSIFFFHKHALGVFEAAEKKGSVLEERLIRIREQGGTSWLFVVIFAVCEFILGAILT
jgi:hypothetical protein